MGRNPAKTLIAVPEATEGPLRDPIPAGARAVLSLFEGPLATVRFPELDADVLAARASTVLEAQREVEALERALDDARARTCEANAQLATAATAALAYAKIYARDRDELQPLLDAIVLPQGGGRHEAALAPRRRGRPRKDASTAELLPSVEST
ncbi:MAG: hypothetical protein IPK74_24745 [Deltaproteobacteria bacterium]|nr:hypothetical protein [Deltaproteobacteria bacterium]